MAKGLIYTFTYTKHRGKKVTEIFDLDFLNWFLNTPPFPSGWIREQVRDQIIVIEGGQNG